MSDSMDPFELLRREAGEPEPSEEAKARALAVMRSTLGKATGQGVRRRLLVAAAGLSLLLSAIVGVVLFRPSAVQAALGEVASAARAAGPRDIPDGGLLYTRSQRTDLMIRPGDEFGADKEFVAYLLPTTREVWRSPAERFIQTRTTSGTPLFFTLAEESAYYANQLDEADGIGSTLIDRFTDVSDPLIETNWPVDVDELKQQMVSYLGTPDDATTDQAIFALAISIIRESNPTPELRGALLEVLAELDLELISADQGSVTLKVGGGSTESIEVTISDRGELLGEKTTTELGDESLGIPAGTTISQVEYLEWNVVSSLS